MTEAKDNADTVMAEAKRRIAAFIPIKEEKIALTPYESDEHDAPEKALRLIFLNGSELDISVDALCERLGEKGIDFYCTEGVEGNPNISKKEWNNRATLQGLPVNAYESELPTIYLFHSPDELVKILPLPRHNQL